MSNLPAREQLLEITDIDREVMSRHTLSWKPNSETRTSAVLILFGALDHIAADHVSTSVANDLDVLLMRRSDALRKHAGQISFPGGGTEPDDASRAATALREAVEETGLDATGVEILRELPDFAIPVSNYLVTPVLAWWHLPSDVAADHSESVEVFRVPVADLIDPEARATSVLTRGGESFRGPAFMLPERFGGHVVWGFTAIVLSGLFDTLGWAEPYDRTQEVVIDLPPSARPKRKLTDE